MQTNPKVVRYGTNTYAIRFTRSNHKVLAWVQDLFGRKAKDIYMVSCPIVQFDSKEVAEKEVIDIVIPYLIREKGVEPSEIIGW